MKIEVFGPGCARCEQTHTLVRNVLARLNVTADLEYITDIRTMAGRGILITPAVAIDGTMVSSGHVPKEAKIEEWIRERLPEQP